MKFSFVLRCCIGLCISISYSSVLCGAEPSELQSPQYSPTDWPLWRGPAQTGIASSEQDPPTEWDENTNVQWRAELPGRGHGSPIVVGTQVWIATADRQRKTQSLFAFDRTTGKRLSETKIHEGTCFNIKGKLNKKATLASSTPASDGTRIFVNFLNGRSVFTSAVDLNGTILWQTKLSDYVVHQGYGSSPAIYKNLVISAADNKGGGAVVAMRRDTGKIVWRRGRPKKPNYPSPIVIHAAGNDQMILTGCNLVTSLNPETGETIWETEGATTECVTSTVTDGKVIMTSGGYPDNHMSAVSADGSGEVAWRNTNRCYVPSMLMIGGHVYAMLDAGIAVCINAGSGKEIWKKRIGGTFSSSLVCVGDLIYASNESGSTTIFKANPVEYEFVAKNQLGTATFATMAISGNQIFNRITQHQGDVAQEYLYCIGK